MDKEEPRDMGKRSWRVNTQCVTSVQQCREGGGHSVVLLGVLFLPLLTWGALCPRGASCSEALLPPGSG